MGCACSDIQAKGDSDMDHCTVLRTEKEEKELLARVRQTFDPCWAEVFVHIDSNKVCRVEPASSNHSRMGFYR